MSLCTWRSVFFDNIMLSFPLSDADCVTLDSNSRITYDLSGAEQYTQSRSDSIKLRFKTNTADGLMLFADGNQGDYIALEMVRGRLYLSIDLGELNLQGVNFGMATWHYFEFSFRWFLMLVKEYCELLCFYFSVTNPIDFLIILHLLMQYMQ